VDDAPGTPHDGNELSEVELLLAEQQLPQPAEPQAIVLIEDAPFWSALESGEELSEPQAAVEDEIETAEPASTSWAEEEDDEEPSVDFAEVDDEPVAPATSPSTLLERVWARYPRWVVGAAAEIVLRILWLAHVHPTAINLLSAGVLAVVAGPPLYKHYRETMFRRAATPHFGDAPQLQWVRMALPRDEDQGQEIMEAVLNELASHTNTGSSEDRRAGRHQLDLIALSDWSDPNALHPRLVAYLAGDDEVVQNALQIVHTRFRHVETIPTDPPFAFEDGALARPMRARLGLSDETTVEESNLFVTSRRAFHGGVSGFAPHAAHSILASDNISKGRNDALRRTAPISSVYAAFSSLQPGQRAFVRLSARRRDAFNAEAAAYKRALEYDTVEPVATTPSWRRRLPKLVAAAAITVIVALSLTRPHPLGTWAIAVAFLFASLLLASPWFRWIVKTAIFELDKESSYLKHFFPNGAPARPVKGGADPVKPLAQVDKTPQTKAAIKDAETAAAERHYESILRVCAIGRADDDAQLEALVDTAVQQLSFEPERFPIDALRGYMGDAPEVAPRLLGFSAAEISHIAPIPDDTITPHDITVYRQPFRGVEPVAPIVIGKPGPNCELELYNPPKGIIPLGTLHKGTSKGLALGLSAAALDRHGLLLGTTGSGKSELLKWLIYGCAKADYPVVLIDPHGKLSMEVMDALIRVCPERINDLVLCDISDPERPVGFNPLDIHSRAQIGAAVSAVTEMLSRASFDIANTPRAFNYTRQILTALTEANLHLPPEDKNNIMRVGHFLMDPEFRHLVTSFSTDEDVKMTFGVDGTWDTLGDDKTPGGLSKAQEERAAPILRAFQTLSASESFKRVFSSPENKLEFGPLINNRSIVLVRLARFHTEQEIGMFIASLVLPWLLSSIGEWGRESGGPGCRVFVDESPRLLSEKSPAIQVLAEARKWDLSLFFAAQFLEQFERPVLQAALGNTNTKIVLQSDISSAKMIAESLDGGKKLIKASDIAALPKYHGFVNAPGLNHNEVFSFANPPMLGVEPGESEITLTSAEEIERAQVIERSARLLTNRAEMIDKYRAEGLKETKIALQDLIRARELSNPGGSGSQYGIDDWDN
jgi:hypothetical protein